jgi:hypothetical protein
MGRHSNTTRHEEQKCKIKSVTIPVPGQRKSTKLKDREFHNVLLGKGKVVMSIDQ